MIYFKPAILNCYYCVKHNIQFLALLILRNIIFFVMMEVNFQKQNQEAERQEALLFTRWTTWSEFPQDAARWQHNHTG